MYVVLKLLTKITVCDNGEETTVKLGGCLGYFPVFDNLREAEFSAGGKFQIIEVMEISETDKQYSED